MFSDLTRMIEQVGKDKGIEKQVVVDAVVRGLLAAARKKWGTYREIEAQYNDETGEVELFEFKEVVQDEDFIDEEVEIKLTEAVELDPEAQVQDSIGIRLETKDLGRIAAQVAKQHITHQVRDAEREIIMAEFEKRRGEVVSGIARRVDRGAIVVDLGRTEAYLPLRDQIPGEQYKPGDRIQGYILDVRQTTRGPQIVMSRASEHYMIKLFSVEVPEISEGVVEMVSAAREPGQRAKVAVLTKDSMVDPVGACVGMKGSRVQNIVQELHGEKIDVVHWDEEPTQFVCNALAPAEISKVFMDDEAKSMEVVVPDGQLSLAIGRKGQNVRLASKLTGWKIDILAESKAAARTAQSLFNLMLLPKMSDIMARHILQSGFGSFAALSEASLEEVQAIPGYEKKEKAQELVQSAQDLLAKYKREGTPIPTLPEPEEEKKQEAPKTTGKAAKQQAEQRLKQAFEEAASQESEKAGGAEA